ncbi:MAG: hypothetical protein M0Q91_14395 [Methanoregula sp.]|nr:hypothetical protein [Methanoregula sp.]
MPDPREYWRSQYSLRGIPGIHDQISSTITLLQRAMTIFYNQTAVRAIGFYHTWILIIVTLSPVTIYMMTPSINNWRRFARRAVRIKTQEGHGIV